MTPILEAININIGYGRRVSQQKKLLSDFHLKLNNGEMLALVGPNGAGKSSLLRVLAGLQLPVSGKVLWKNRKLADIPFSERPKMTSVLFSSFRPAEGFTVGDIVAMGRIPYTGIFGRISITDRHAIDYALEQTGIASLQHTRSSTLSDGEFQKTMLAKMLAQNTDLLILDEPTSHLDVPSAIDFVRILKGLAVQKNKTILFSSHDLNLAFKHADKILILDGQGNWALDCPEAIAQNPLFKSFLRTEKITFYCGNLVF